MFITPNPFNIHIRPSYPSELERIPNDSRVDVITIKQTRLNLDMGSFVTLKQFPYKVGGTPTSTPTPLNNATLIPVSSLYLHNPPQLLIVPLPFAPGRHRPGHCAQAQRANC